MYNSPMVAFLGKSVSTDLHSSFRRSFSDDFRSIFNDSMRKNEFSQVTQKVSKKIDGVSERLNSKNFDSKGRLANTGSGNDAIQSKKVREKDNEESSQKGKVGREDIEFLSQASGLSVQWIEQLLSTEGPGSVSEMEQLISDAGILPSMVDNELAKIAQLLNSLKDAGHMAADSKIAIIDKLQGLVNQVENIISEQDSQFQQQVIGIVDNLKQEISQSKKDIAKSILLHKAIEEGINKTAEDLNKLKTQQSTVTQDDSKYLEKQDSELNTAMEAKEIQKNNEGNHSQSGQSDQKDFAFLGKVKIVDLRSKETVNQPYQMPFNEVMEIKYNNLNTGMIKKHFNLQNINKENIVKQVVENAKFTLSDDRSEMVMQLKPDNLGKLALKIVTERGMMVAKFTAESQQVKEIIEASLPQLKDALESQGLNVKGFSVSVGDHSAQNQAFERASKGRLKKILSIEDKDHLVAVSGYNEDYVLNNPYQVSDSSIDFTA
ncbi:MAG: flagellar hook-length control protein [Clostridia bacterium]|nr:flagellar hook-length control protein [Clostridia bacterium]